MVRQQEFVGLNRGDGEQSYTRKRNARRRDRRSTGPEWPGRWPSVLIVAAIEGGIILARVEQSERPLLDVADEVERLLQTI